MLWYLSSISWPAELLAGPLSRAAGLGPGPPRVHRCCQGPHGRRQCSCVRSILMKLELLTVVSYPLPIFGGLGPPRKAVESNGSSKTTKSQLSIPT